MFLLFDLEILLVYPYAVSTNTNDIYGLSIMLIFFVLLTLGFVFELGKGALTIESRQTSSYSTEDNTIPHAFMEGHESMRKTSSVLPYNCYIIFHIFAGCLLYILTVLLGIDPAPLLDAMHYSVSILMNLFNNNILCDAPKGWAMYFPQDSANYYHTCFALLVWAIILPIAIEILHFYKDNLKSKGKFILTFLWVNLTITNIYLVMYAVHLILALVGTFEHIVSNELTIFSLNQYAHVGDDSPISFEDPNLNVLLSTNNSSGSAPIQDPSGSGTVQNPSGSGTVQDPSGSGTVQNPYESAPDSDVDMDRSSSSSSDTDSAYASSSGEDHRTYQEIDASRARHGELADLEAENVHLHSVLDARSALLTGQTLTQEQENLINDNNHTSDQIVENIIANEDRITELMKEMGEYSSESGGESDGESNGESNNGGNS